MIRGPQARPRNNFTIFVPTGARRPRDIKRLIKRAPRLDHLLTARGEHRAKEQIRTKSNGEPLRPICFPRTRPRRVVQRGNKCSFRKSNYLGRTARERSGRSHWGETVRAGSPARSNGSRARFGGGEGGPIRPPTGAIGATISPPENYYGHVERFFLKR